MDNEVIEKQDGAEPEKTKEAENVQTKRFQNETRKASWRGVEKKQIDDTDRGGNN